MVLTDEQRRYYDNHIKCPKCRHLIPETSLNPPPPIYGVKYRDTVNITVCADPECGWRGRIDELRR